MENKKNNSIILDKIELSKLLNDNKNIDEYISTLNKNIDNNNYLIDKASSFVM